MEAVGDGVWSLSATNPGRPQRPTEGGCKDLSSLA